MKFRSPYWTDVQKANLLQRWIIVHSILYYEHNTNIVTDLKYSENCVQLVKLQKSMSITDLEKTRYYYCFYDFDGSTGFHLFKRLNKKDKEYLLREADNALKSERM